MKVAIIGGAGAEGIGLALRLARAGHQVVIASRSLERARAAAERVRNTLEGRGTPAGSILVEGTLNAQVGQEDVVVLSIPYHAHHGTLSALGGLSDGSVVVDLTVPLIPGRWYGTFPAEGQSACEEAQQVLGDRCPVVGAFHTMSAHLLVDLDRSVDSDVLICGDSQAAKDKVAALARSVGIRPVDVGELRMARTVERITPLLVSLNIRYRSRIAGIRITGIDVGNAGQGA
ncbi:MAG TPA: NADPH-dependent F420 reductase [Firmicutes bacterium]|nr:NADPH-dependent F420 reductase [Bacillota bacterium]